MKVIMFAGYCGIAVVFLALTCGVSGYNKEKVAMYPPSQPGFILEKWLGRWYLQARLASCAWSGSNEFDNWDVQQTLAKDNSILGVETWRSQTGACTTVSTRLTRNSKDGGCFIVKDTFGDTLTGDQVVVATDYTCLLISWGCVKKSVDGRKCDDPWVTVTTRKKHPTPETLEIIEAILQKIWNLSLREMRRIKHDNACHPETPPYHPKYYLL